MQLSAGVASLAAGLASGGFMAPTAAAAAEGSGTAFANGIDPTKYVGGDGSYEKYRKDGIRLGLIESYPVNYLDKATGKRTGWNTDLVLAALEKSGITKIEYVEGPWESMVPGLQSGRFDLLASDVHVTPERVKIIDFSSPVFWYGDILVVQKGNAVGVSTWDSLAGKTVGTALGVIYTDWLNARTDLKALQVYKDDQTATADLIAGRIDAYVAGDANYTGFLSQNQNLPVEIVKSYVPKSELSDWTRFGFRQEDKDMNNVFSRAIGEMFIDGTTLAILKKYGLGERNLFVVNGLS
jgi:ABC-type amino acid transport substrate-binding protein